MKKILAFCLSVVAIMVNAKDVPSIPDFLKKSVDKLQKELIQTYGADKSERIVRGINQAALFWRKEDGSAGEFEEFVKKNLYVDKDKIDALFKRFESKFEAIDGYLAEINYELRKEMDLDVGELMPVDEMFGGYDFSAHINEDFFKNKLAFVVLLNFPLTTFQERIQNESKWTRREWAEARLAQRFSKRVPSEINQNISKALAEGEIYTSEYKIWMHHLIGDRGERYFPEGMNLVSHWNLRDEIKAQYANSDGLIKQRIIQKVMERIITQTIPQAVINNPSIDWNPFSNTVTLSPESKNEGGKKTAVDLRNLNKPEPDTRYSKLLNIFHAVKAADPYCPYARTFIERKFNEERQISENDVEKMLDELLSSPLLEKTARLIEKRLGRPLEPFDIWYNGFSQGGKDESELDKIVSKRYPDAKAFQDDMENILQRLGFSREQAEFLKKNIQIEPSRGTGHAMGHSKRGFPARLRTRVSKEGMDYKGYNIAMHEFGHNVEQVFSLNKVDHTLLAGVPNNACTEAIAYVFQERDLQTLGLADETPQTHYYKTIQTYWMTCEIAAVALVEMKIWNWLYKNPSATPAQLREATLRFAKEVWNKYYAKPFNRSDVILLAVYSHMFFTPLYLSDYPLGHIVSFGIEEQIQKSKNLGSEIERITSYGNLTPDMWMINAIGSRLSAKPLLSATQNALDRIEEK
jgi:hypothetical protein